MVPLGSIATIGLECGPRTIYRYNQYVFAGINVMLAPGVSTGEGMSEVGKILAAELPPDYGYDWTNMSFHENRSKGMVVPLLALAIVFGYLFLVAQYESWIVPVPVMASVWVAACGALAGLRVAGLPFSIYAQLGLVLLVGLASKSAILIVEFAFASGAGAESRRAIGVATFSGMVASVVVGTLLVPGLYVLFCGRCNNK